MSLERVFVFMWLVSNRFGVCKKKVEGMRIKAVCALPVVLDDVD